MSTAATKRKKNNAHNTNVQTQLLERLLTQRREEIRRMEHDKLMILIEINRSACY